MRTNRKRQHPFIFRRVKFHVRFLRMAYLCGLQDILLSVLHATTLQKRLIFRRVEIQRQNLNATKRPGVSTINGTQPPDRVQAHFSHFRAIYTYSIKQTARPPKIALHGAILPRGRVSGHHTAVLCEFSRGNKSKGYIPFQKSLKDFSVGMYS